MSLLVAGKLETHYLKYLQINVLMNKALAGVLAGIYCRPPNPKREQDDQFFFYSFLYGT